MIKNLRWTVPNYRNSGPLAGVWITDSDCLVFVYIILDNIFSEDIEWSAKEDVIGWVPNNIDLQVQSDVAKEKQNIICKA